MYEALIRPNIMVTYDKTRVWLTQKLKPSNKILKMTNTGTLNSIRESSLLTFKILHNTQTNATANP
jgi:hypothetical protein